MKLKQAVVLYLALVIFNCDNRDNESKQILFSGGTIYTSNNENPFVEAVLVENGEIKYVGSKQMARKKAPKNVTEVDLTGKTLLAGFHDVHMHPLEASSPNFSFTLDTEATLANTLLEIEDAVSADTGDGWILGWGHYIHTVLDGTQEPVDMLDAIENERPMAIMEATSHSVWVNSQALTEMGYTVSSENPVGGVIMKDFSGDPNGILIDNAGNLLFDRALTPTITRQNSQYDGLVSYGLPLLAASGITSFTDARVYWGRNHHLVWQDLADDGELTARVSLALWAYPEADDAEQINSLTSLFDGDGSDYLRINQVKFYMDGIVQNTTAIISENYIFDLLGLSDNSGVAYFTSSRLEHYITALEGVGYDFLVHVIGDQATADALDAFAMQSQGNARHRLTHLELVSSEDYTRFSELGVIADMQVAGEFTNPSSWEENEEFVPSSLAEVIVPLKSLNDAGAMVTLSSDWDVSTQNPMVGLQHAVTRDPQALSLREAIDAYTINAAFAMRQENLVGSIEEGKRADLIVLDDALFEISESQIGMVEVEQTYLDGRLIFKQ